MRRLTMRQLVVFEAVARHLSFSKAALELHLSQPAVSMQVRQIESFIGLPLTEQVGKKIFLTEAGRIVFHASNNIAAQLNDLGHALTRLKGVEEGLFRIAVTSTVNAVATDILAGFRGEHPKVSIHLQVSNRAEVLALLAENQIDLAIMGQVPEGLGLTATRFMANPLVVIAPPDHRWAQRITIPIHALAEEPFVEREEGSGTQGAMERFFAAKHLNINRSMVMTSNEAIKMAVQAKLGLGIISQQTLEMELMLNRLIVLPVEGFPIMRHWYVVHRANKLLSPIAQAFKDFLLTRATPSEPASLQVPA
ncbi:MAG: LysR family transcriptional regulator [Halothiobacillaceae bacterium]|nr:LysR family transcriptional regulator [Halothiobacillaceae bacterium]HUN00778.1 LysR family transcriptional regulator [Halothiobacillus sp.]